MGGFRLLGGWGFRFCGVQSLGGLRGLGFAGFRGFRVWSLGCLGLLGCLGVWGGLLDLGFQGSWLSFSTQAADPRRRPSRWHSPGSAARITGLGFRV